MFGQFTRIRQSSRRLTSYFTNRPGAPALCAGLTVGLMSWTATNSFVAAFGYTQDTLAGLVLATTICFALGVRFSGSRIGQATRTHSGLIGVAALIFLPTTLAFASQIIALFSSESLATPVSQTAILALAAIVTLGISAFCAGWNIERYLANSRIIPLLAGVSLGVALPALVIIPLLGLFVPLVLTSSFVALDWLRKLASGMQFDATPSAPKRSTTSWAMAIRTSALALLTATATAISGRMIAQLMPEAAYLLAAGVATFLASTAFGVWLAEKQIRRDWSRPALGVTAALLTAVGLLAPLTFFPLLVHQHLSAVANVNSVLLLMSIRLLTVAAFIVPVGCGFGMALRIAEMELRPSVVAFAFALGLASGPWLMPVVGLVSLALATAFALAATGFSYLTTWRIHSGRHALATATAITLLCLFAIGANHYQPQRAAKLLFDTETFISHQRGVPRELLPYLDDTRLVSTHETCEGTVTLWKKNGVAFSARLDGVPIVLASTQTDVCPTASGDLMRVVLPLVLHEKPRSLLLLNDPAFIASRVATGFPLRDIVCLEREPLTGKQGANEEFLPECPDDERLSFFRLEPSLGLKSLNQAFDVIVSEPGSPAAISSTPYFTEEFYSGAVSKLTPGGIFCQRWRSADLGPEPLRVISRTMQEVFTDVMLIEIGVGEYAILGTVSPAGLVREGLLDRLQRPQVRRTLATLGWDWCIPLNLMALDHQAIGTLARDTNRINDVANNRFAYSLPPEMMRWGPKAIETAEVMSGRTTRLLEKGVPFEEQKEVIDRIAQVTGQRTLMTQYPDQPWAYRKEVRAQLKESPRSVIQTVNAEVRRVMHPEDRRRLDYFEALGKAIGKVNLQTLADLESFAEPYDPMITYFLRHEIAPLYSELGDEGAALELRNRLHAAYYADPKDRSVRNVIDAIELLVRRPDLVPDSAARFDHLNGLVEVLLRRWENRGTVAPRSPEIVMVDIDNTLDSTEAALRAMDELASAAGFETDEWQLRQQAIDRTLTRPLRKYRTTLMPHLRKARKESVETDEPH